MLATQVSTESISVACVTTVQTHLRFLKWMDWLSLWEHRMPTNGVYFLKAPLTDCTFLCSWRGCFNKKSVLRIGKNTSIDQSICLSLIHIFRHFCECRGTSCRLLQLELLQVVLAQPWWPCYTFIQILWLVTMVFVLLAVWRLRIVLVVHTAQFLLWFRPLARVWSCITNLDVFVAARFIDLRIRSLW